MNDVPQLRVEPQGFKKLEVWQLGRQLASLVYDLSALFPKSEDYGLKQQVRRAAISVPSNIAEGWGHESAGMFVKALKVARGSLYELDTQLILAQDFGYLTELQMAAARDTLHLLGRKLYNLIERVEGNVVRELRASYAGLDPEQLSPFSPVFPFSQNDFLEGDQPH
ncbi:MAG: four helix bundle protein [Armatimonadetes bacterium]|nr:four helix bundle protein [Armatimonadota bacterium]